MDDVLTLGGVRDGLRRCTAMIADCESRIDAFDQQESTLRAVRGKAINRREQLRKAQAALEAQRLVMEAESEQP